MADNGKPNPSGRSASGQTLQQSNDLSPVDGGEGFVGSNTGSALGLRVESGKTGYSKDYPIWDQQSSTMGIADNAGSSDADEGGIQDLQDSRDEKADWKRVDTSEGLPQTAYTNAGNGGAPDLDAGDKSVDLNTQSVPSATAGEKNSSDMPQTEFTHNDGGGAPIWKR